MSPIDKIRDRIEGLQALLRMSIRLGETELTRYIRKNIEGYETELRILRVRNENKK